METNENANHPCEEKKNGNKDAQVPSPEILATTLTWKQDTTLRHEYWRLHLLVRNKGNWPTSQQMINNCNRNEYE